MVTNLGEGWGAGYIRLKESEALFYQVLWRTKIFLVIVRLV